MILRTWKDICRALGGMHENTARRLVREEGLPVEQIGGRPMSTSEDLEKWVSARVNRDAVKNKIGHSDLLGGHSDLTGPE